MDIVQILRINVVSEDAAYVRKAELANACSLQCRKKTEQKKRYQNK
jgi:hypothetical protein